MALLIGIVFLIVAVGLVAAGLQTRRQAASIPGGAPGTVVGLVTRGPAATDGTGGAQLSSLSPVVTVAFDETGSRPTRLVGDSSIVAALLLGLGSAFTAAAAVILLVVA
ncbi:hypothetical protein [Nakamurella sp. PAMC28650]|uniref:hypothetical protein n=1 Tax=Nakamurella sp. PAMC28650 TaxID=2762325 RepID=UPI00164E85B4|nr:hypothetical protein [Nakamurella sp. PAMC28650]QNK79440.1 hypothetical protein H7F38_14115 [Nakamurella sp. PAMC28650]